MCCSFPVPHTSVERVFQRRMATSVEGSGARPCDACREQRARWYCSADDAHLCNACDTQVHTANAVARRHERVSLTTTTPAVRFPTAPSACWSSSWLRKRSRSGRRHGRSNPGAEQPLGSIAMTDIAVAEDNADEEQEPLSWLWSNDDVDVPLGWLCNHRVKSEPSENVEYVKTELEPDSEGLLDLNFDFCLESEEMKVHDQTKLRLQLNYDEVLSAWSNRGSPWAQVHPIMYPFDDTISDLAGHGAASEFGLVPDLGCAQSGREHIIGQVPVMIHGGDGQRPRAGGREARVMRYREKRQSRLFYKKIRYHVRKLNAENRPRMKGRFVKRTGDGSFVS